MCVCLYGLRTFGDVRRRSRTFGLFGVSLATFAPFAGAFRIGLPLAFCPFLDCKTIHKAALDHTFVDIDDRLFANA